LRAAVDVYEARNWKKIAAAAFGSSKTDVQCLHRWQKVLRPGLVKGPWSKEEDRLVTELVAKHGLKKWSVIAQHLKGRLGKQCRERYACMHMHCCTLHNALPIGMPAGNSSARNGSTDVSLLSACDVTCA
jgi:hypothetical protein